MSTEQETNLIRRLNELERENQRLREQLDSVRYPSNFRFERLAENANALIFEYADGHLTYVNKTMADILRRPINEILMHHCTDLMDPDSCSLLQELASQCQKSSGDDAMTLPRAKVIAYLALNEVANNNLVAAEQVSPVYLRDNVAKKAKQATAMV